MPLKATVESLDAVDEQYRGLYKQTDKGFRLDAEGVEFEEDVVGLKNTVKAARDERDALKKRLRDIPEDFDPERWNELTAAEKKAAEEQAKKEGQWDKLAQQMRDEHTKQQAQWSEERAALEADLANELIDARVAMLLQKPGLEGSAKLLLPHVRDNTRVLKGEDGKRRPVVVEDDGETPRINAKTGEPMTVEELLIEMRDSDDFAGAFKGSGAAGGGAPGRGAAGGGGRSKYRTKADFGTVAERVAFIGEHGQEAYLALPQS